MPVIRRALFVTPFALTPRTEGHRKRMAMTFDRLMADGYQVDVLFISREYEWSTLFNADTFRELQSLGDVAHFVHAETPGKPIGDFYQVDEWWPEQATEYCRWLFANNGYEIVFCNYIFMSRVYELCERATVKVLDTHDLFADRQKLLAAHGLPAEFFYTNRRNESAGLDRADFVIAIKNEEAGFFRHVSDADVITLPYVEDITAPEFKPGRRQPDGPVKFGFFGSRNSINVRNVAEFIKYLEENVPEGGYPFEFWLYGSLCSRMKGPMPSYVKLGGMVRDVDEFYDNVDAVVNPQYFSTGLKIKIAEALAYGAPLISHRHSFEGFGRPLDPAHNCKGFDEVLAAMMDVVANDARLAELAAATRAVQARQVLDCDNQWAKILRRAAARNRWLYMMVDAECFNRLRFYRHIIEMVFVTFAKNYMICLVAQNDDDSNSLWKVFRRKANRYAHALDVTEVEQDAIVAVFDVPAHWESFAGGDRCALLFEDAARMAADFHALGEPATLNFDGPEWLVVRSKGAPAAPDRKGVQQLVNYFRWLPWDMSVVATGDQYDLTREIWLLTSPDVGTAWPDLLGSLFPGRRIRRFGDGSDGRPPGGGGGALAVMDMVFSQKLIPELVFCLTHDLSYVGMKSWFSANGVTVRELAHYVRLGEATAPVDIMGLPKLSEFTQLPDRSKPAEIVTAAWEGSGWRTLTAMMKEWKPQTVAA